MSHVVSMRLKENQMERLRRMARRLGRTPSETSAMLVEEGLRQAEFAYIDFRSSSIGRQAYVRGSSLAVWEVIWIAQAYQMDVNQTAEHLGWPAFRVQAAFNYAAAFPEEIEPAIQEQDAMDFEKLKRLLPQLEVFDASQEHAALVPSVESPAQT
jgi:hypothetical protein